MKLEDALYNWLQIRLVSDARPDDAAASDTERFFAQILKEDHGLEQFTIGLEDETMYHVHYVKEGKKKVQMFDRVLAGQLLDDIQANPKYNE